MAECIFQGDRITLIFPRQHGTVACDTLQSYPAGPAFIKLFRTYFYNLPLFKKTR